jgi:Protein kinase domain
VSFELPRRRRLGRFDLLYKLADGGMGEVYAAMMRGPSGFEKLVVVKMLHVELQRDLRFVSMFRAEARVLGKLNHPNISQIVDYGVEDGVDFMALEYVEGLSLSQMLRAGPLPPALALGIADQLCIGLHYAHQLHDDHGVTGLVHRDVSPSNVMVDRAGLVKLLDFGIAKLLVQGAPHTTRVAGKAGYMSPEQVRGEATDARTDVFAAAAVVFEMVTAAPAFRKATDFLTFEAILTSERPQLAAAPPPLQAALHRALRVSRAERTPSIAALRDELAAAAPALGGGATSVELAAFLAERFASALQAPREQLRAAQRGAAEPPLAGAGSAPVSAPRRTELADDGAARGSAASQPRRRRGRWGAAVATLGGVAALWFAVTALARGGRADADPPSASVANTRDAGAPARHAAGAAPAHATVVEPRAMPGGAEVADVAEVTIARARPAAPTRASSGFGKLTLDAEPYAEVELDGEPIGTTPIASRQVAAGRHRVVLRFPHGEVRRLVVDVPRGGHVRRQVPP